MTIEEVNNDREGSAFWIGIFIGIIIGILISFLIYWNFGNKYPIRIKHELVQKNHAEWVTNEHGKVYWKLKEFKIDSIPQKK